MTRIARFAALLAVPILPITMPTTAHAATEASSPRPQIALDELIAADRAFAAAAAEVDTLTALSAMMHEDVIMPLPDGRFARGRAAAIEAMRANRFNSESRAEWAPVRGGISADGQHGFTFGYMTLRGRDGSTRLAKYLAYWVRTPQGWRAIAYKRAPRPEGAIDRSLLPPALPPRLVAPNVDAAIVEARRQGLRDAERAFSDEAQRIGLGAAFRRNGSADAMNMGQGPSFLIGASAIGDAIGGEAPPSPVSWAADEALVASSGDLGVTFGLIRPNGPVPAGRPAASAFFTIWRRAGPEERWLYVAE